jgi:hypothetical protein
MLIFGRPQQHLTNLLMYPFDLKQLVVPVFVLIFSGCQEQPEYGGFLNSTGTGNEGSGNQSITINLGATTTASTVITYHVGGNAALDGDYSLTSVSTYYSDALTVTVPAGESMAAINFAVIDDNQVEQDDEVIYFEITSISDAAIAENFRQASYAFQIEDNDIAPDAGLQVDLSWNLGDGVRINRSNFDLHLADAITLSDDGTVEAYREIEGMQSVNETGFETITIGSDLPDQQYYVIISCLSCEDAAALSLQLSSRQASRKAVGYVPAGWIGRSLYYGPITKSGVSFSFK